jgi:hypothetical protein
MIFDWVRAPGGSHTIHWYGAYWDAPISTREEREAYYDYFDWTWNKKGSATSIAVFDILSPGQAFTALPSEFKFESTEGWPYKSLLKGDLTKNADGNAGWVWNPISGTIDPRVHIADEWDDAWLSTSSIIYGIGLRSDRSWGKSWDVVEITERGHWALRETGDLTAFGGGGNDRIYGGTGNDRLFGEAGDDEIYGGLGPSFLSGGQGKDILTGGIGRQTLDGGTGNDTLIGGTGDQTLIGGTGQDLLIAGRGRQMLDGGSGKDTLQDGDGDTVMLGGSGADTFVFKTQTVGSDTILDFNLADDHIRFDGINGLTTLDGLLDRSTSLGDSTMIDLGEDHTVLLMGVDLAYLTARAETVFAFA